MMENRKRSILKTLSWRTIATITTTIIAFALTGQFKLALSIGVIELFTKLFLYYIHERAWTRLKFGIDAKPTDYQI
jgi:uncharacterized membrane protein